MDEVKPPLGIAPRKIDGMREIAGTFRVTPAGDGASMIVLETDDGDVTEIVVSALDAVRAATALIKNARRA